MAKRTEFVPLLHHLRAMLETMGLIALLLAWRDGQQQRRIVRRLIEREIARGDAANGKVRRG